MVSSATIPVWEALTPLTIVAPWLVGFGVLSILISLFRGV